MGFSVFIDIVGSIIIGGIILMTMSRFSDTASQNTFRYTSDLTVQQNLTSTSQLIESDFRKIGYCSDYTKVIDASKVIITADSFSIRYTSDIDRNGTMDTIRYCLGPTSELSSTFNPRDKMLYRVVNSQTAKSSSSGITKFYMIYFSPLGDTVKPPIADLSLIAEIEVNINFEDATKNDTLTNAYYRQVKLSIQNLKNR